MKHLGGYPSPVIASCCWITAQAKQEAPPRPGGLSIGAPEPCTPGGRWRRGSPLASSKAARRGAEGWGGSHRQPAGPTRTCAGAPPHSPHIRCPCPSHREPPNRARGRGHSSCEQGASSLCKTLLQSRSIQQRPEGLLLLGYFLFKSVTV